MVIKNIKKELETTKTQIEPVFHLCFSLVVAGSPKVTVYSEWCLRHMEGMGRLGTTWRHWKSWLRWRKSGSEYKYFVPTSPPSPSKSCSLHFIITSEVSMQLPEGMGEGALGMHVLIFFKQGKKLHMGRPSGFLQRNENQQTNIPSLANEKLRYYLFLFVKCPLSLPPKRISIRKGISWFITNTASLKTDSDKPVSLLIMEKFEFD